MIDSQALDALFRTSRTQNAWQTQPVSDDQLRAIYDLVKMGPTAANSQPTRLIFLRSAEAKERLKPALSPGNVDKTMSAPVVAIVGYDTHFHQFMPKTFPHNLGAAKSFEGDENAAKRETVAFRNGSMGGAYLIMAIRAVGLDAGPMSGFDNAVVDRTFFPDGRIRSNFLCNIGIGDPAKVMPRLPRLDFDEACQLL